MRAHNCFVSVERVVDEEFSSSSADRFRTYAYPKGTKKSHSLPDSALIPLCCINNSEGGGGGQHYNTTTSQPTKETSLDWVMKKRLASKSDGDSPSIHDELHSVPQGEKIIVDLKKFM
jgi:hypothetical protein